MPWGKDTREISRGQDSTHLVSVACTPYTCTVHLKGHAWSIAIVGRL